MKPGSGCVHVGQRVRPGQLLEALGNSGNSATPHLHLQLHVTPSFISDGLPFVFVRFQFLGQITEPFSEANLGLRPTASFASPRPDRRVPAASRCRSAATRCNFLTEHKSPDSGFLYRAMAGTGRGGVKTWTD
jgi:hypothetical protein